MRFWQCADLYGWSWEQYEATPSRVTDWCLLLSGEKTKAHNEAVDRANREARNRGA